MTRCLVGLAAVFVLVTGLGSARAFAQAPSLIAIWGGPTDAQAQIHDPTAVAVDPATGNVFIGSGGSGNPVVMLDRNGSFVRQWSTYVVGEKYPGIVSGLVADGSGHVYLSDRANNSVKKYTVNGTYLTEWGPNFDIGHPGSLNLPTGLALDADGLLYVADAWNNQVQVFTSDGAFVRAWGAYGSAPGQFMADWGIAVSRDGRVYVSDYTNARVQVFGLDGTFLSQWGVSGSGAGQFNDPFALALGPDGTLYVSETYYNHRIQAFRPDGTFLTQWGSYGAGSGQFNEATALAVAADGTVYVADDKNGRVQVFGSPATAAKHSSWGALKTLYR